MLKWYLDKDPYMFKFEFQICLNTKYTVEILGTLT